MFLEILFIFEIVKIEVFSKEEMTKITKKQKVDSLKYKPFLILEKLQEEFKDWNGYNEWKNCPKRDLRECSKSLCDNSFWHAVEHELFLKVFVFQEEEYRQGIRLLHRLLEEHPEWNEKYSPEQIVEGAWKKDFILVEEKVIAAQQDGMMAPDLPCRWCKKKGKVSFLTKQMRSGDEGESVFYQCSFCGGRWREG